MVVERKVTVVPADQIPSNGWPNMQVQLWCYGWIDDWATAPEVMLTGHIWRKVYANFVNSEIYPRFVRSDPGFHARCLELFEIYGGEFVSE